MANEKFDPMKEISNLRDSVGRVIEQGLQSVQQIANQRGTIKVDVYEAEDMIVIRTQPIDGLVANSIEVSVENDILTVSGVTQPDEAPMNASYILQERVFGTFSRQISLPLPVKAQEAKAKVKQQILTVSLPIDRDSYTHIEIAD